MTARRTHDTLTTLWAVLAATGHVLALFPAEEAAIQWADDATDPTWIMQLTHCRVPRWVPPHELPQWDDWALAQHTPPARNITAPAFGLGPSEKLQAFFEACADPNHDLRGIPRVMTADERRNVPQAEPLAELMQDGVVLFLDELHPVVRIAHNDPNTTD